MSPSTVELAKKLATLLSRHKGQRCEITQLVALSGGANNQTWRFSVPSSTGGGDNYILRLSSVQTDQGMTKEVEADIQRAAGAAHIPVAPVTWVLTPQDSIGSGYIMSLVEGETIPRKILRDEQYAQMRNQMAFSCGQHAARIHAIDPLKLAGLELMDVDTQISQYEEVYRGSGMRLPVIELALRWIHNNRPTPVPPQIVHGDYRNGNFIVGPEGIRAILDWELAHLGDPMEDLAWLCVNSWRYGNWDKPVGGFGQREDLFSGYETISGTPIDPCRVHFWEVMGTLKWGIMCMMMSASDEQSGPLAVERAVIGRRTSETELDLLELLTGDR
ncbi:MAG: phosphotransferase family protein [Halieaceae bacterium]|jgi:aminoglycoside phosphotransferase (APT) family kinase protein|nr:phosphotransferase family protein [Halieaceae bacterium]